MWITWGADTAHLLPRLIAGRERGPLFLSEHRPGPHLLGRYGDGLQLHQLRHSAATHLGEANVIMTKTEHKSLRSVQRYVKPGLAAVHEATEALSSPRRRS
jgi:integrase